MGKAKVNSKNYSGLQDIELVLEMGTIDEKRKLMLAGSFFLEPCYPIYY
jgi:hypothetical protein